MRALACTRYKKWPFKGETLKHGKGHVLHVICFWIPQGLFVSTDDLYYSSFVRFYVYKKDQRRNDLDILGECMREGYG